MTREERRQRRDMIRRVGYALLGILAVLFLVVVLCGAGAEPDVEPDVKAQTARAVAAQEYDRVLAQTGSVDAAERCAQLTYEEVMESDW